MKILTTLSICLIGSLSFAQTCNKLNHNCSNTSGLNTSGVTSNGGSTYACSLGNNVLYSSSSNSYIATDDISIAQGASATLHFDARKASGYFGTCEVWVHVGGYCNFSMLSSPFDDNGWVEIGTFSPTTSCSNYGPFTVPSDVIGGQNISYCIVPKNASSSNWVSIDNICVSEITGGSVATTMNEDFGTSSSGWYPNSGVDDIPYHTYKNASTAYTLLSFGADGGSDKAAYFYTGFDFCSTVSGVGIVTKEINTSGYTNGEIRLEFKSKYPCSGTNSYTFDEDYTNYSPEVFVMQGADHGSNTWTALPINYYFADYNWRVASYDISAYKNANVRFKIERGGFCATAMEAVDNIKVFDRDCSISLESCGTITGETAPLQNTDYAYSVPAVTGATYYKWYVRHDGNLYDTAPYIVSGQGTQTPTINFQSLPSSGVRVLCIPFDTDPSSEPDACYAQIGLLGVTVSSAVPLAFDNVATTDASCFSFCDGSIDVDIVGGDGSYTYSWNPNVSTSDVATGLCEGDYEVTVTDGNLDQIVQTITINEPAQIVINCPVGQSICDEDTVQLLPTFTGGTAPYTSSWTPATNISDENILQPFVWPSTNETYELDVIDVNGCTSSCSIDIVVNPLPVPDFNASQTTGCSPLDVIFNPIPAGGSSCVWDFGDGNTDALCSTVFNSYTTAGDYDVTLTVTDGNGCVGSTTFVDFITVIGTPTVGAGNDTTICAGDEVALTANNPDAAVISWDNGISDGIAFSPSMDTLYVVTADNSGCVSTDTVEVLIQALPLIDLGSDITSCEAFVTLDAGAGWDSQTWSNTQTTQSIDATSTGDYWVSVESNGCFSSDTITVTLLDCSAILDLDGHEIRVYPNPTSDFVTIIDLPVNSDLYIYDTRGALIKSITAVGGTFTLDLSTYKDGNYILSVQNEGTVKQIQIVKQ